MLSPAVQPTRGGGSAGVTRRRLAGKPPGPLPFCDPVVDVFLSEVGGGQAALVDPGRAPRRSPRRPALAASHLDHLRQPPFDEVRTGDAPVVALPALLGQCGTDPADGRPC